MNREDNLCWFHGKVSRERAEEVLREEGPEDGVFLVRESNTASGDYVLSVLHKGEIWHYQIRRHGEDAFFSIDEQTPIHGLDSLIEHYRESSHGLVTRLSALCKKEPPPHDSRSHGRTNLLHRATKERDLTVVTELLKCGYRNIDAKNQDGQTAVHLACKFGNLAILKQLIERNANVNSRDSTGNSPLHYACQNQSGELVRTLINAKANIQSRNNESGYVPLHDAAKYGNLDAVKEILAANAPHMPRTTLGLFPIDFAKEGYHNEVVEYLENYTPTPPVTHRGKWCHGTLSRDEANFILKDYARSLQHLINRQSSDSDNAATDDNKINNDEPNSTSGVFLVRYSDRNGGNFVLTLLHDDTTKHFIIQSFQKHLFIDEGPYLTSLEHLVQHYSVFSDGLPTKLRHPVPPKPKPPVPLFSTMPKQQSKAGKQHSSPSQNSLLEIPLSAFETPSPRTQQRNMSLPSDDLINKVGIFEVDLQKTPSPTHAKSPKDKDKDNLLNFRSLKLKSPKKNIIIDGMKSLRKNKKSSKQLLLEQQQQEQLLLEQKQKENEITLNLMKNLTFSTEFAIAQPQAPLSPIADSLYNVPTNNCAVYNIDIGENKDNLHLPATPEQLTTASTDPADNNNEEEKPNYFIESDVTMSSQDKGVEEIYFVDAPTKQFPQTNNNNISKINNNNNNVSKTSYVSPKQINSSNSNNNNNNIETLSKKFERFDSNMSQSSCSEFINVVEEHQQKQQKDQINNNSTSKLNYFIPKASLVLDQILGVGEFGSVYKGIYRKSEDPEAENGKDTPADEMVAIKTLHDEHCKANRDEFLREASVMIRLRHHCIVKLIGICKGPPLMMIQELVSLGSMLNYLLDSANQINPNCELKIWASQIACGMQFLETQHFVHRDLAARNILLASRNQAKISDFGLSRALGAGNDYYQASQGGKWPIKWYAPESFNYGTFSHASDVWSFGVTLWEMFSFGQPPYGDLKGVEVIQIIETGKRLEKPEACPDNVFNIMENCWNYKPKDRPCFKYLTEYFMKDPDYQNLTELIKTKQIV